MSVVVCVHQWSIEQGSGYPGSIAFKSCPRCHSIWVADPEKGFVDEPRVVLARIEERLDKETNVV